MDEQIYSMDTKPLQEEEPEEIFHVHHYPDALLVVKETIRKDATLAPVTATSPKSIATPPAMPVIITVFVALLLPLVSLLFQWYLLTHPFIATILVKAQQVTSLAHVYPLPPVTMQQSQVVTTTGHRHIAATQAHGLVTFYNGLTAPQVIDAGTLLVGSDGEEVVTDQNVTIPAGSLATNGYASVPAHALDYGPAGNIQAGDIYGPCCRAWIKVVNSQFTGGHAAREYAVVTKADITTATASLLARLSLQVHLSPGEKMLTPVPCSTHVTSNHRAGDEASQVVVTAHQSCSPSAYRPRDVQSSLISLVAGKTKQAALGALLRLPGVRSVSMNWADDMKLPPAKYIHLDILVSG